MNEILQHIGSQKMPSTLENPFAKSSIVGVYVNYSEFCGQWSAVGQVTFRKGNTEEQQKFKGKNFDEVVTQIKAFILELENEA